MPDLLRLRLSTLASNVKAAGLPVDGLAITDASTNPPTVRLDFSSGATVQQKADATALVDAFDWSQTAQTATELQGSRSDATAFLSAFNNAQATLLRAFAAVLADEINICRAAIPRGILSITRVSTTATAITRDPHGLQTGDTIRVQGATLAAYNVTAVATVVNTTTFTYPVAGSPVTPAVGPGIQFTLGSVVPSMAPRTLAQARTAILAKIAAGLVDS